MFRLETLRIAREIAKSLEKSVEIHLIHLLLQLLGLVPRHDFLSSKPLSELFSVELFLS